jgi:hypothetical protein
MEGKSGENFFCYFLKALHCEVIHYEFSAPVYFSQLAVLFPYFIVGSSLTIGKTSLNWQFMYVGDITSSP